MLSPNILCQSPKLLNRNRKKHRLPRSLFGLIARFPKRRNQYLVTLVVSSGSFENAWRSQAQPNTCHCQQRWQGKLLPCLYYWKENKTLMDKSIQKSIPSGSVGLGLMTESTQIDINAELYKLLLHEGAFLPHQDSIIESGWILVHSCM
jgi:hypothetical protein